MGWRYVTTLKYGKMRTNLLIFVAVATMAAACSQTDGLEEATISGSVEKPITFTLNASTPASSKIAFTDDFDANSKMFIDWEEGDSFVVSDGTNNLTFSYTGSENVFTTTDGELYSDTDYTATLGTIASSVSQSASGDANHLDEMMTLSTSFTYSDNLNITFAHDMVVLRIKFTIDEAATALSFVGGVNNVLLALEGATANEEYTAYIGINEMTSGDDYTITVLGEDSSANIYTFSGTTSKDYVAGRGYGSTFTLTQSTVDQSGFYINQLTGNESFNTDSAWVVNDAGELNTSSAGFANLITLINSNSASTVSLDLSNITAIPENAFDVDPDLTGLGTVTLNESGVTLGACAFKDCKRLTTVVNMGEVTEFGGSAFMNCNYLTTGADVAGVTSLSQNIFRSCSALATIANLDGITTLGGHTFRATAFTSLVFPAVTTLGAYEFQACSDLVELKLTTNSAITVNSNAFTSFETSQCTLTLGTTEAAKVTTQGTWNGLEWLKILDTDGDEIIPGEVVYDDSSEIVLANLTGSENFDPTATWTVTDVGTIVNDDLTKLATLINAAGAGAVTLVMPNVTEFPAAGSSGVGLRGCTGLKSITFNTDGTNGVTIGNNAIRACTSLTTIVGNISSIGNNGFAGCTGLTSLTLTYSSSISVSSSTPFPSDTTPGCTLYLGSTEYDNADITNSTWSGFTWSSISLYEAQ